MSGLRPAFRRIADAPEESLDRRNVDRNDVLRYRPVRRFMNVARGFRIRCVDQTECGASFLIEPVCQEFDPIPILYFQILAVRFRDTGRGFAFYVVTVHEYRHASPPQKP